MNTVNPVNTRKSVQNVAKKKVSNVCMDWSNNPSFTNRCFTGPCFSTPGDVLQYAYCTICPLYGNFAGKKLGPIGTSEL